MRVRIPPVAQLRSRGQCPIRVVENCAVRRSAPPFVHSSRDAAAANDRAKLAPDADDLLDLNRGLGEMYRDLMETHAHVDVLLSPKRRASESGVRQSREACIGTRAGIAE